MTGRMAAAHDQGVTGGKLADHVRGHHVVPDPPVLITIRRRGRATGRAR